MAHQRARGEETMIMTMTTIVTVIGTTMDKLIAGMVDTISIDDERLQLVRNI